MTNFLSYYKKYHQNLYSLIVSLLLATWYNGVSGLLNYYLPNRGPFISIILLIIPLFIFLMDDGKLNELYLPPGIQYPIIASTTSTTSTQHFGNVPETENNK